MGTSLKNDIPDMFLREFSEQVDARRFLWRAYCANRIASSYLFAGPAGVGKFLVALQFIKFLKCSNRTDGEPCGECRSCRTIDVWDNPDIFIVFPMPSSVWNSDSRQEAYEEFRKSPYIMPAFKKASAILLPMIHEIQHFLSTSATEGGGKFVLVPNAHKMNKSAANAFLKTLEEPPPGAHIFLSTDRPEALLPTIRSRTQIVRFRRLSTDSIVKHLVDRHSFAAESANMVASLAEGSMARALLIASDEFQQVRQQAVMLLKNAAQNNLTEVWEWATSAPARLDYANSFMSAIMSMVRDVAVAATTKDTEKKLMLNIDYEKTIRGVAMRLQSSSDALSLLNVLSSLYENLKRNPQYALFYNAVAAIIAGTFMRKNAPFTA